jgi:hypothetical protein
MSAVINLLRSYAAAQVLGIRDVMSGLVVLALAAGVALFAFAFVLLAGFWMLASILPQWQAALVIAGIALLAAFLLRVIGLRRIRRHTQVQRLLDLKTAVAVPESPAKARKTPQRIEPMTLVLLAALAGIVAGRRLIR